MKIERPDTESHNNQPEGFSRARPPYNAIIELTPDMLDIKRGFSSPYPTAETVEQAANLLWGSPISPRFVLYYHTMAAFQSEVTLSAKRAYNLVKAFRKNLCLSVYEALHNKYSRVINPFNIALGPIEFDLDGLHINPNFFGTGLDFYSTKQAHFDIIEPIGSNLYGLNFNVYGGFPLFMDVRAYCLSRQLNIRDILTKIPGSRNLTVKEEHYKPLLEEFSVAFEIDMTRDAPFTIILNRVEEAGLMHGATDVTVINSNIEAYRPISHFALDNVTDEAAMQWYAALGQDSERALGDPAALKPLIPPSIQLDKVPLVLSIRSSGRSVQT